MQVVFLKQYIGYLVVSILVLSRGPTLFSHLRSPMVEVRQGGYIQNSAKIWKQEIILGLLRKLELVLLGMGFGYLHAYTY